MPHPAQTSFTRRQILVGVAGVALLAGCTTGPPVEPEPVRPDPLAELLDEHVALAAVYTQALASGAADARLTGLAGNLDQHIQALAGALAVPQPSVPSATSGSTSTPPGTEPGSGAVPDPVAQLGPIRDGEAALAARTRELAIGQRPQRAALLASIAAAHQCAVEVLS